MRFPAEWERHSGTLMMFPVFWQNGSLAVAREHYLRAAEAIATFEPVTMIANSSETVLARQSGVDVLELPHDDAWARDICPTFVLDGGAVTAVNWKFNAWGGKYPKWDLDDDIPRRFCERGKIPLVNAPLVLEGGGIHTNGAGTLLTTAECLLHPNRNPDLSQREIETQLKAFTGADRVVWLPYGLHDDTETDGHVDNVCCFAAEDTVLLHREDGERGDANLRVLKDAGLRVVELPKPQDVNLPAASYVNFYLCNGAVIAPKFDVPSDARAAAILREMFPAREVVQIYGLEILRGGGNIHCITQQIPEAYLCET
ncbi:MAG: agmatine deiminase family protein [Clostridium sp.]|jgi:agmatine deiminase|nr:agmatine deiminase family protein [Clostridium sp.]